MRATATSLSEHEMPTVEVSVPGSELTILCRIPDPLTQLSHGKLDLPLLTTVVGNIRTWQDILPDADQMHATFDQAGAVIDDWVIYVALDPRIVQVTPGAAVPPGCVDIDGLRLNTKLEIVMKTTMRMAEEARSLSTREREFPGGEPADTADRPDRETV